MTSEQVRELLLMSFAQGAGNKLVSAAADQALDEYFDADLRDRLAREWKLVKKDQTKTVGKLARERARKDGQHAAIEADSSSSIGAADLQSRLVPCEC